MQTNFVFFYRYQNKKQHPVQKAVMSQTGVSDLISHLISQDEISRDLSLQRQQFQVSVKHCFLTFVSVVSHNKATLRDSLEAHDWFFC